MARISSKMEMGNLTCRFGEKLVLLDLFDEIIHPAFFGNLTRSYDETKYFFEKVKLFKSEEGDLVIAGRLIKDTIIEREQIYVKGVGLVDSVQKLESAPSSVFALILKNHRLVYLRENRGAPSMETFRSTLLNFIRNKHRTFLEEKYREEKAKNSKANWTQVLEKFPLPTLELIPLTSDNDIEGFLAKYSLIKTVEFRFSDRNDETDNNDFFEDAQMRKDRIGSKLTTIKHANNKGLNKDMVTVEVKEGLSQGNQAIKVTGIDQNGDSLNGNNESFQVKIPFETSAKKPQTIAKKLVKKMSELAAQRIISLPIIEDSTKRKIQRIIDTHFRQDDHEQ